MPIDFFYADAMQDAQSSNIFFSLQKELVVCGYIRRGGNERQQFL